VAAAGAGWGGDGLRGPGRGTRPYMDEVEEDFIDEGFFSALDAPAALDDARLAAALLESQRASAAYPPLPLRALDGAGAVRGAPGLPLLSGSAAVLTPAAAPASVGRSAQKRSTTPGAGRGRGAGRGITSGSPGGPPKGIERDRNLDSPGKNVNRGFLRLFFKPLGNIIHLKLFLKSYFAKVKQINLSRILC